MRRDLTKPERPCPQCGGVTLGEQADDPSREPHPNECLVCLVCGSWLIDRGGGERRLLRESEIEALDAATWKRLTDVGRILGEATRLYLGAPKKKRTNPDPLDVLLHYATCKIMCAPVGDARTIQRMEAEPQGAVIILYKVLSAWESLSRRKRLKFLEDERVRYWAQRLAPVAKRVEIPSDTASKMWETWEAMMVEIAALEDRRGGRPRSGAEEG